ncbi:hypothetical protein PVAND_007121 [Polypedilum vanderplanki]|uniref:RNA methyltransferase n=1 Tax=Polypedilum vanderplanki TaxID=319348 RepID=A0A9J6C616_POLVA|nr:hypothetical protein PVAND_007121 [Polypedilum vanderplanki]
MILKNKNNNKRYSGGVGVSKFFLPEKRARRNRQKFLLGGSITDPLNLNSLQNESETNDNDPSPNEEDNENKVELIIPPNINDPLNLLSPVDKTEYELQLAFNANIKKKRPRKRYKSGSEFYERPRKKVAFANKLGTSPLRGEHDPSLAYDSNVSKESSDDETADPSWEIIDRSAQKDTNRISPTMRKTSTSVEETKVSETITIAEAATTSEAVSDPFDGDDEVTQKPVQTKTSGMQKTAQGQYGNFNRYFGFEGLNKNMDVRLQIFQRNVHLFKNKDVLDVGCNCGLMTLSIAKIFSPKSILGIDIDKKLITIARSKLRKYVAIPERFLEAELSTEAAKHRHRAEYFPMSFPTCYGNLGLAFKQIQKKIQTPQTLPSTPQTPQNETQNLRIPENISFEEMNYVPKSEVEVFRDAGKYDLILCLSVTKWIHLNYGDQGLRLTFRKIFNQLRPGGKLILELQNWPSYKKKKKMTEQIHENYKNIKFHPSNFADFLLSQEVGFSHFYTLGLTQHLSKGFKRPIYLFVKGEFTPKAACKWSDVYFPSTTPYPRRSMVYARQMNLRYAPLPSWLSPMPSPYPLRVLSQHGTPYYNPQQSDYMPSYDDVPRNHQFAFMSPSSHSSSPRSPSSSSKRSIDDDQQSPSRHHLYHLITDPDPPKSTNSTNDTQNSND